MLVYFYLIDILLYIKEVFFYWCIATSAQIKVLSTFFTMQYTMGNTPWVSYTTHSVVQFQCCNILNGIFNKVFNYPPLQKPQKPPSDDEDDDSNSLSVMNTSSRDRPGRAKKEVKYFHESDNEEDDDDNMFD